MRAGIKFAGTDFPIDSRVIPLSEGQTDYELALESGWAFKGVPLYVVGWAGYRWRTEDESTGRQPGDERFAYLAVGGPWGNFRLEIGLEMLDGLAPVQNRVSIPGSARHLVQLSPAIGWAVGPGSLEIGGPIPLSGRNVPTGPGLSIGYLLTWAPCERTSAWPGHPRARRLLVDARPAVRAAGRLEPEAKTQE